MTKEQRRNHPKFVQMLEEVPSLVKFYIQKFGKAKIKDVDDLIQNTRLRLIKYPPDLNKYKHTTCVITAINHSIHDDFKYDKSRIKLVNCDTQAKYDENFLAAEARIESRRLLKRVSEKHAQILRMYFGIDQKPKNLREIGKTLGLTKQGAAAAKQAAIDNLQTKVAY